MLVLAVEKVSIVQKIFLRVLVQIYAALHLLLKQGLAMANAAKQDMIVCQILLQKVLHHNMSVAGGPQHHWLVMVSAVLLEKTLVIQQLVSVKLASYKEKKLFYESL